MYFEHMNPHRDLGLEDSNPILIKSQYYLKVERFSTYLDKVQTHGHGDSSILHPHLHNRGVTKGITPMRLTKRLTIHQQFNCCHIYLKKKKKKKKIHQQGHHTRGQITQWA